MSDSYVSLYNVAAEVVGSRQTPIEATNATLAELGYLLMDFVLRERLPAVFCTGFQAEHLWPSERHQENAAQHFFFFGGDKLQPEANHRQTHVPLRGPDPLSQEWFLLVLTEPCAALLCAREHPHGAAENSDRCFSTLWSVEPDVIAAVLPVLAEVVARERPVRLPDIEKAFRRFPPVAPDPQVVTLLMHHFIDALARQHQARLRLERPLVHDARLRSLGHVLSSVAHELNNPLQSILGFGALLLDEPNLPPSARSDLQHIITAAERARMIVQNTLQLSRSGNDGAVAVHIGELIDQTLVFVRSDLASAGVEVSVELAPSLPTVVVRPFRIQQLLINLLTNAAQALKHHTGPRRLLLRAGRSESYLRLVVQDSGPGIPPEVQPHIFEPFWTTKPVGEGTGLGLGIVKAIVDEHHGTIVVASEPGKGATFTVSIPLERAIER